MIRLFLVFMFLVSCSGLPKSGDSQPVKSFLYDLRFKVNDFWHIGFGIPQGNKDHKYRIEIEPPGDKIDRLIITTCHRQDVIDKPGNVGWFNKSVIYDYSNHQEIENLRTCPMHIYALEEKSRRVGFGFIDFQDDRPEFDLSMSMQCNGKTRYFVGRGFCQSAETLVQKFTFPEKVIVMPSTQRDECKVFDSSPSDTFEFKMPQGLCAYQFVSKRKHANGERVRIRIHTYGVTDVPVRF